MNIFTPKEKLTDLAKLLLITDFWAQILLITEFGPTFIWLPIFGPKFNWLPILGPKFNWLSIFGLNITNKWFQRYPIETFKKQVSIHATLA